MKKLLPLLLAALLLTQAFTLGAFAARTYQDPKSGLTIQLPDSLTEETTNDYTAVIFYNSDDTQAISLYSRDIFDYLENAQGYQREEYRLEQYIQEPNNILSEMYTDVDWESQQISDATVNGILYRVVSGTLKEPVGSTGKMFCTVVNGWLFQIIFLNISDAQINAAMNSIVYPGVAPATTVPAIEVPTIPAIEVPTIPPITVPGAQDLTQASATDDNTKEAKNKDKEKDDDKDGNTGLWIAIAAVAVVAVALGAALIVVLSKKKKAANPPVAPQQPIPPMQPPMQPSRPVPPVQPQQPVYPVQPQQPVRQPAQPVPPTQPAQPVPPAQPTQPAQAAQPTAPRFCPACGAQNAANSKFCQSCGKQLQ